MHKSIKNISSIQFPIFALRSDEWRRKDGVLFLEDKVLDDTNCEGTTLGVRRVQCGRDDLYKLAKAYKDLPSMLLSKKRLFIDSNGVPFRYKKTVNAKLKYHLIKRIDKKETLSVVYLKGILHGFPIPRPPYGDAVYARIVYYQGCPWYLFDFARLRGKDSYIKI